MGGIKVAGGMVAGHPVGGFYTDINERDVAEGGQVLGSVVKAGAGLAVIGAILHADATREEREQAKRAAHGRQMSDLTRYVAIYIGDTAFRGLCLNSVLKIEHLASGIKELPLKHVVSINMLNRDDMGSIKLAPDSMPADFTLSDGTVLQNGFLLEPLQFATIVGVREIRHEDWREGGLIQAMTNADNDKSRVDINASFAYVPTGNWRRPKYVEPKVSIRPSVQRRKSSDPGLMAGLFSFVDDLLKGITLLVGLGVGFITLLFLLMMFGAGLSP